MHAGEMILGMREEAASLEIGRFDSDLGFIALNPEQLLELLNHDNTEQIATEKHSSQYTITPQAE